MRNVAGLAAAASALFSAISAGLAVEAARWWWQSAKVPIPERFFSYSTNVEGVGIGHIPSPDELARNLKLQSELSGAAAKFAAGAAAAAGLAAAAQAVGILLGGR